MKQSLVRVCTATVGVSFLLVVGAMAQEKAKIVDPKSPSGLDYYAQGGVVVDGIAYFTSTDGCQSA